MTKYTHYPFLSSVEEYKACCEEIRLEAQDNSSVVALYLLGSPWVPGVSDIDIVVVYRDTKHPMRSPWEVSAFSKKVFSHRYLSFSEEDFKKYFSILYPAEVTHLQLLSGRNVELNDPREAYGDLAYREMLYVAVADILFNKLLLPPLFGSYPTCNVRRLLGVLHSISYTEQLLEVALGKTWLESDATRFVGELREGWLSRSEKENFVLLEKAQHEGKMRVAHMIEVLEAVFPAPQDCDLSSFFNKAFGVRFSPEWNYEHFETSYRQHRIKLGPLGGTRTFTTFKLPLSLFSVVAGYGVYPSQWGMLMRTSVKGCSAPIAPAGLSYRAEAISTIFKHTLETDGFYRAPFLYGFSLFEMRHPYVARLFTKALRLLS